MTEEKTITLSRRNLMQAGAAGLALASAGIRPANAVPPGDRSVTIITGSPHKHGASFLLAEEFIKGLNAQGVKNIYRFDAAFKRVTACSGCDHCGLGSALCVYRDDMFELNPHLLESRLIVFCTPLYYFGFSAQMKLVIDRFYAINSQFHTGHRAVLLAAAWNTNDWTMAALVDHYKTLVRYMEWEDAGIVAGLGCGTRSRTERTQYPKQAYELGRTVKF